MKIHTMPIWKQAILVKVINSNLPAGYKCHASQLLNLFDPGGGLVSLNTTLKGYIKLLRACR